MILWHDTKAPVGKRVLLVWGENEDGQLGLAMPQPPPPSNSSGAGEARKRGASGDAAASMAALGLSPQRGSSSAAGFWPPGFSLEAYCLEPVECPAFKHIDIVQVSCGSRHTLAVSSLGAAYSWGWGACGQLGHGNDRALAAPRLIHVLAADGIVVTTVGAGGIHSAAVTGQGHLYTWGGSCYGQTGLGPTAMAAGSVLLPQKVLLVRGGRAGPHVAAAATADGAAVADGAAAADGAKATADGGSALDAASIANGDAAATAADGTDGPRQKVSRPARRRSSARTTVRGVGNSGSSSSGANGAAASPATAKSSAITAATSPAAVADGIDGIDGTVEDEEAAPLLVTSISCGGMHMAAVTPEGTLYAWGRADSGQLGIGSDWVHDTDPHNNGLEWPQQVCGPLKGKTVASVSCGAFHTGVVTSEGLVYTWGKEDYGILGCDTDGLLNGGLALPHPIAFGAAAKGGVYSSGTRAREIVCGGWHTAVVSRDGELWLCGRGEYGRLGLGDELSRNLLKPVSGSKIREPVAQVALGGSHSLVLTATGAVFAFGRAERGRLGVPGFAADDDLPPGVAPKAGSDRCLQPVAVPALTAVGWRIDSIACGGSHSAAVVTRVDA